MSIVDKPTLEAFEAEIAKHVPGFRVAFKDESSLMKVIGFFATPFNPGFMDKYTTTLGNRVYFPSRAYYDEQRKATFSVLAHEFVHLVDAKRAPGWFQFSYLFPQVLALVGLGLYGALVPYGWAVLLAIVLGVVLGCWAARKSLKLFFVVAGVFFLAAAGASIWLHHLWSLALFGGLLCLAPLPSPGRVYWEMRGYAMNLAVLEWIAGPPPGIVIDLLQKHFNGPDYYFMSWSKSSIRANLMLALSKARSGKLQGEFPYNVVHGFLVDRKLLRNV